jgi:hypothetical protein
MHIYPTSPYLVKSCPTSIWFRLNQINLDLRLLEQVKARMLDIGQYKHMVEGRAWRRMREYWVSETPMLALDRATFVSFSLVS